MQILPSGRPPASGLALEPFRGLRYVEGRVSGLAAVTSPPYDVIAHDAADDLLASDPHNVVRLILPRAAGPNPGDAYTDAARLLRNWQDEGILAPDPQPALYVYEQSRAGAGVLQRGLIGALRLTPPGSGAVLPHEEVTPGPVTGRRHLMEATGANLEPIFLLYDGGGDAAATRLLTEVATHRPPLLAVDTADGMRHRVWAMTDPAEHTLVAADLAAHQALIADGHHRYAAYLQYQARKRAEGKGAGPWDTGLALLVDSAAFPPRIGAIHRVVPGMRPGDAVARAAGAFTVTSLPAAPAGPGAALQALDRAARTTTAFLIAGEGTFHLLTDPDPGRVSAAMPGRSPRWRALPAAVLQELLLGEAWGIRDDEAHVEIHHDTASALRAVEPPAGGTAVLCPPMAEADVREVAAHGERVPRKSTSFAPKPRTGLVMRTFALS